MQDPDASGGPASRVTASRPDIVDRNGEVLATDIKTASLFAEPRRIVDADEVIERLSTVLPDIEVEQTYHKLKSGAGFVWLKRQLTPKQQNEIIQPRPAGHRLPHREAALLSGRADRLRTSSASPISTTRASPASRNTSTIRASPTFRPPASPSPRT